MTLKNSARKVWIIGANGFGISLFMSIVATQKFKNGIISVAGFIDDREEAKERCRNIIKRQRPGLFENLRFHSSVNDIDILSDRLVFGISDPKYKLKIFNEHGLGFDNFERLLISVSNENANTVGMSVLDKTHLSSNALIGELNFFDRDVVIGHDVEIGNFNHFGVRCIVGGESKIGSGCIIHSGAIIGRGVTIGDNSEIGLGAIIIRDVADGSKIIAPQSRNIR